MTAASIAHLRIKLDDVEPAVVRRVEVPLTIRLDRLHLVLQAAMGWTNSHLYEIRARDVGWGGPDPDFGDGPLDAQQGPADRRAGGCRRGSLECLFRARRRLEPLRAASEHIADATWGYRDILDRSPI